MAPCSAKLCRIIFVDRRKNGDAVSLGFGELVAKINLSAALARPLVGIRLPSLANASKAIRQLRDADGPDIVRQVECDIGFTL
ncbi:MAG: hypothetical protein II946_01955 [Kiritimatiellae bacterium]|nr:hypothetical protein [Kiritimatiellia bacterium]